ncbi:hypothetical protein [Streptomyces decoyicus]|uniref:hypothetical protein n=1 Tax=Streptomyces decoyicus TaxID=249567 RepID=UPI0033BAB46B
MSRQHRLPALRAERGTTALALNNAALHPGSAVGSALGGPALGAGPAPYALPWVAAGVAAAVLRSTWRRADAPGLWRA